MASACRGSTVCIAPSLRLGSCVGNTAYVGIPLALAFLPTGVADQHRLRPRCNIAHLSPARCSSVLAEGGRLPGAAGCSPRQQPCDAWPAGSASAAVSPWRSVVAEALWWPSRSSLPGPSWLVCPAGEPVAPCGSWSPTGQDWCLLCLLVKLVCIQCCCWCPGYVWRLASGTVVQAIVLQGAGPQRRFPCC